MTSFRINHLNISQVGLCNNNFLIETKNPVSTVSNPVEISYFISEKTVQKKGINYKNEIIISENDICVFINGNVKFGQYFTFGVIDEKNMLFAGTDGSNKLCKSETGSEWSGIFIMKSSALDIFDKNFNIVNGFNSQFFLNKFNYMYGDGTCSIQSSFIDDPNINYSTTQCYLQKTTKDIMVDSRTVLNNRTYYCGEGNFSLLFSDGIGITPIINSSNLLAKCNSVALCYDLWYAVGEDNINSIITSNDGNTWIGLSGSKDIINKGNCIAYDDINNSLIVIGGEDDFSPLVYNINRSLYWVKNTEIKSYITTVYSITPVNVFPQSGSPTRFFISGTGAYPLVGVNLIESSIYYLYIGSNIMTTCYDFSHNGRFVGSSVNYVAVGTGNSSICWALSSVSNGGFPTNFVPVNGANNIFDIAYGVKGRFNSISTLWVAVGTGNLFSIAWSEDGINWNGVANSKNILTVGKKIIFRNSLWIAVGDGPFSIATSLDGKIWSPVLDSLSYFLKGNNIIFAPNNTLKMVLAAGQSLQLNSSIIYTINGTEWNELNINSLAKANTIATNYTDLTLCGGEPSLSTNSSIIKTNNLFNWSSISSSSIFTKCNKIIYILELNFWLAAGEGLFSIGRSVNGEEWTGIAESNTIFSNCYSIYYDITSGFIYATGEGNYTIARSEDLGFSWIGILKPPNIFKKCNDIVRNPIFFAIGEGNFSIATSEDGITWTGLNNSNSILSIGNKFENYTGKLTICGTGKNTILFKEENTNNWIEGIYPIFKICKCIFSDGFKILASGEGINQMCYSYNLLDWIPVGVGLFEIVNSIYYNNKLWLALGQGNNTIAYSYNGLNWTGIGKTIFQLSGQNIFFNGEKWVSVGKGINSIAYSTDGKIWTGLGTSIFSDIGNSICWNGNMWIAGGSGINSLAYSNDGKAWVGLGETLFDSVKTIKFNGSIFVAGGQGLNTLAWSYDGKNWNGLGLSLFSKTCETIEWDGEKFISGGSGINSTLISYNGKDWISENTSILNSENIVYNIFYQKKLKNKINFPIKTIFTMGTNGIYKSIDNFETWSPLSPSNTLTNYYSSFWTGDKLLIVGQGDNNSICYSENLESMIGLGKSLIDIGKCIYGNKDINVAGGIGEKNTLIWSVDGLSWFGCGKQLFANSCNDIFWNGKIWVAVGSGLTTIGFSLDGKIWKPVNNKIFSVSGLSVFSNGYIWVSIGSGNFNTAYSFDGETWVGLNIENFLPTSVYWNGEFWIISDINGKISKSYDGILWETPIQTIFSKINSVKWVYDRWFAVSYGVNSLGYSFDGINWVYSTTLLSEGLGIYCIENNANIEINCPVLSFGSGKNSICYSCDGLYWQPLTIDIFDVGNNCFWNGKMWIGCGSGDKNTLAYSVDGLRWNGLGKTVFREMCYNVFYDGSTWFACGIGTNTLAYSVDGLTWNGLGSNIFSLYGKMINKNDHIYISVGWGINSLAWSLDGFNWNGDGLKTFSIGGNCVTWVGGNINKWLVGGEGVFKIASSENGRDWNQIFSPFLNSCNCIVWNGKRIVSVGSGNCSIAWSDDGIHWVQVANSEALLTRGNSVTWTGKEFIAAGKGAFNFAVSTDGIDWIGLTTPHFTEVNGINTNTKLGASIFPNSLIIPAGKSLSFISDTFNNGYSNITFSVKN